MKILEKDIQLAVCDYLAYKGHFFWRQNNIPAIDKYGAFRAMPKYSKNGIPDIILIKDGKFIGLEIKLPKGKQSDSQKAFENGAKMAGAEYYIITSLDDLQKVGL